VKYYTGLGSRTSPPDILELMTRTARWLRGQGWTLRSGHAQGADRAFELGAESDSVIYLPWKNFGQNPYNDDQGMPVLGTAITISTDDPITNYRHLAELGIRRGTTTVQSWIKLLHGRNAWQIQGHAATPDLSKFALCWCPVVRGEPQGGTATAVKLAVHHKIPVFNLFFENNRTLIEDKIR
jgi:hypothetical protein